MRACHFCPLAQASCGRGKSGPQFRPNAKKGCAFVLESALESPMTTEKTETQKPPRTVVVIDDDLEIRETLSMMLKDEGYPVEAAYNGQEALDLLGNIDPPGLLLVDLTMPVMDGNTLMSVLDEHPKFSSIPVVILTAVPRNARPGPTKVLSKPVDFDVLLKMVGQYCGPTTRPAEAR